MLYNMLKVKIQFYGSRFLFNFFWLADMAQNIKPLLRYVPLKSHLTRELPQICESASKAIDLGLIFCPSKKGAVHDGCFYNPKIGKITEIVQFKLKEEGAPLYFDKLELWACKYKDLDIIDIGFQSPQDWEQAQVLISDINDFSFLKGFNLVFTSTDYSSYKLEYTCRPDIKDILEIQASFNEIVTGVNEEMISSSGEILTQSSMFF